MNRPLPIISIVVAFLSITAFLPSANGGDKPNILIIMSDDSGYADLGCYGGEIETPHIDQLASSGVRFNSFYTNGRCSPTRASLFSGLYGARVGFGGGSLGDWSRQFDSPAHRGRLPYEIPLLPEILKTVGYRTLMSGKWHLGGSNIVDFPSRQAVWEKYHPGWTLDQKEIEAEFRGLPPQRGFDEFFGMHGAQGDFFVTPKDNHQYFEGNHPAQLTFKETYEMHCYYPHKQHYAYTPNHGKTSKAFYDTDGVTDRAIKMIQDATSADQQQPFFAYVAYRAPHTPLQAPEELVQKYLKYYDDLDQVQMSRLEGLVSQKLIPEDTTFKKANIDPEKTDDFKRRLAVHAAMMHKIDENVGRLLNALDQTGETDNTLILYFSDNGAASHVSEIMNKPYGGAKALVYEGGAKTHFIASWPGQIQAGTLSRTTGWVGDLMPTLLEVAQADYPANFRGKPTPALDGRNLLPALKGKEMPPPETLFFNDKGQQSVIFKGRWKLMIEPGWYLQTQKAPGIAYELYDLQEDPTETKNLAADKPEMVAFLAESCQQWKTDCGILDYAKILEVLPNDPF